jgi:MOSC domain-containing protein YiiM
VAGTCRPSVKVAGTVEAATIWQVSVSSGGVPKRAVAEATVTEAGLQGDLHNDRRHHGGPDRAICLFALERVEALAAEGHPIAAGSTGENITTRGLDWNKVVPGTRLRLGADVIVEITSYAAPCKTNRRWFKEGHFNRMNEKLHPGWSRTYARVIHPGVVRPGQVVELLDECGSIADPV